MILRERFSKLKVAAVWRGKSVITMSICFPR